MYRKYVFYYLVLPYSEAQRFRQATGQGAEDVPMYVLARRNAIHTPMTPMVPACSSAPAWQLLVLGWPRGRGGQQQAPQQENALLTTGRQQARDGRDPRGGEGVQIIQGAIFEKQKNLCV